MTLHQLLRWPLRSALAVILALGTAASAGAEAPLTCERIPQLQDDLLRKHIVYHYLNDEIRARAVDTYLLRLDPSKRLLLQSEADALRAELSSLFHDVRSGRCEALAGLQKQMLERYKELEKFVRGVVSSDDYALDPDVVLIMDPRKRGYPKTPEDRDRLNTELVHFQMSNYLSTDIEMAEAKEKLIHRYELMVMRASEISQEDLYAAFLDAFASSLDPHSNYFSREALEDFQISMALSLEGIGVALSSRDGYAVVEKIIPGGAADSLDVLMPKDKVIAVAQEEGEYVDIIDMDLRDVVRLIRGKRGTKVHLNVLRQGDSTERLNVTIVRDRINLEDQAATLRFENTEVDGRTLKLAVLELPSFYGDRNPSERQSSRDVRKLLDEVREQGADGLLLDLSRNGGGLLENSVRIAGFFIDEGGVVAVKDAFAKIQVLQDPDDSIVFTGPMVVLTSRVSASASEIVAGAMKDYQRAIVVGDDHTFGKGTVQSMHQLPQGLGALKVTTGLFFRPGGDSTQHSGVPADVIVPSLFSTDELGEKHQDYSLPQQQIAPFLDPHGILVSSDNAKLGKPVPWRPVTSDVIAQVAQRSADRLAASEEFAEIREKLADADRREGVVHLSEILKENEEAKAEASEVLPDETPNATDAGANAGEVMITPPPEPESDVDDDEPSPQQLEALRVLGDFVVLTSEAPGA